ncbi:hypothetical protein CTAYLR_002721 [Chrysophaeum taylorii]|uniref:Maleylacetate reductase n=1 Tax=Chrysophaeum taylorii TaxID=2483200 RepID=A0AAD7UDH8_9STRA|nr:hypothetical protein CTAYLR_002721 [Chrysophaeum taylorii]
MESVVFGVPAAKTAARMVEERGAKRVLMIVSGTLNRETDEIAKVRDALGPKVAATFDRMGAHTPRTDVLAATAMGRKADADLILTFGGGSVTDGSKAAAYCLANDISDEDSMDKLRDADADKTVPPSIPQISIPTTLSAGEFSALSGVTNTRTKKKELFKHPAMMPRSVILDPAATVHTPEWLFLSTGIRAVDHCVEGICSHESNPYGDAIALEGLSLFAESLPRVKADPTDLDARLDCMLGTWMSMAPLVGGVPMGASHGIGYVLGAAHGIPHGHTSCIMLPDVMRWNKAHNADKQALIAEAMGHPGKDAGDVLDDFISGLGMPRSLSSVNVGREDFEHIASRSMGTPWVPRNPRPIKGPEQILEILEMAL